MSKQSNSAAIIPEFDTFKKMREERAEMEVEEAKAGTTSSEKTIADLAAHSGWSLIENHVFTRIQTLQDGLQTAISNSSDFEAIGQRAVVVNLVQEELEGLINFVRSREKYINEKRAQNNPQN